MPSKPPVTVKACVNLHKDLSVALNDAIDRVANGWAYLRIVSRLDATLDSDSDINLGAEARTPEIPLEVGGEVSAGFSRGTDKSRSTDTDIVYILYRSTDPDYLPPFLESTHRDQEPKLIDSELRDSEPPRDLGE
jgi:hypothetical protein